MQRDRSSSARWSSTVPLDTSAAPHHLREDDDQTEAGATSPVNCDRKKGNQFIPDSSVPSWGPAEGKDGGDGERTVQVIARLRRQARSRFCQKTFAYLLSK